MQAEIILCAVYLQIRLAFMNGNFEKMMELMYKMRNDITIKKEYNFVQTVEICEGNIYAGLNQKNKIPKRLMEADLGNLRLRFPAFAVFQYSIWQGAVNQ